MDVKESFLQGEQQGQPQPGVAGQGGNQTTPGAGSTAWPGPQAGGHDANAEQAGASTAGETTQVTGGENGGVKFRRVGDNETMQNQNPIPATVITVNHEFAGKTFLFPSTCGGR